jgi:hypothetical protein
MDCKDLDLCISGCGLLVGCCECGAETSTLVNGKFSRSLHYYDSLYILLSSLQTCSQIIFPASILLLPTPVVEASYGDWTTLCYTNFIITLFVITPAASRIFNSPFLSIGLLVIRSISVNITTWLMVGVSSSTLAETRQFPSCSVTGTHPPCNLKFQI